jgi:hypothetical protein
MQLPGCITSRLGGIMSNSTSIWLSGALLVALAAGCGSNNQVNSDRQTNSYSQLKQKELASERQEFISDHRQQLDGLDNQIARLETRLTHEGRYVDAQQRAEWSQELFELRQQQRRTRAELERAENATPEEWAEMRGTIGNAVDSVEAGVQKLAGEMGNLFSSNEATTRSQQTGSIDLCELRVDGTNAELVEQDEALVVRLTTTDQRGVENLRARADRLKEAHGSGHGSATTENRSKSGTGTSGTSSASASGGQSSNLVEDVSVEDVPNGVRVIFTPAPGQRTTLRQQLSNDVEQIRNRSC